VGLEEFMTVDESMKLLDRFLAEASPEPAGVWDAFREWACRPVACEREELEVALGYEDGLAWIEFRRTFEDVDSGEEVVLQLSADRPDAPRLADTGERCANRTELAAFFARVEELPGFRMALRYPYWQFAVERG
jgi:hypothetical protein